MIYTLFNTTTTTLGLGLLFFLWFLSLHFDDEQQIKETREARRPNACRQRWHYNGNWTRLRFGFTIGFGFPKSFPPSLLGAGVPEKRESDVRVRWKWTQNPVHVGWTVWTFTLPATALREILVSFWRTKRQALTAQVNRKSARLKQKEQRKWCLYCRETSKCSQAWLCR